MTLPLTSSPWRRWLAGALLLVAPLLGWAQADPPARVAYVSALEGAAQLAVDGQSFAPASINWPLTTGSRIVTDPGARAELHSGTTALRLTNRADLSVTALDDSTIQVALTDGTLSLRVRELRPGERVEIDTPQLAVVASQAGEYRIDVDLHADTTRLTVHAGSASVYGESGQQSDVGPRQQVQYSGRGLVVTQAGPAYRDGFDQWVAARDAQEDRSPSARYLPRDVPGYQQLDAYGEWSQDATYGPVWYPQVTVADWAPYRYGRWAWVEPWGWTWVDDAPWGFAPSHYGRWAQIGPRWAWVPGRFGPRPVYAPAVVGFVGGGAGWGVSLGSGGPGAAWFPLAPGEYWAPHYHASDRYRRGLNWGDGRDRVRPPPDSFYFQRRPNAISVAPVDQFGAGGRGRRPHFGDGSRLPAGALDGGRVVAPPPRAWVPGVPTQAPLPTLRPERPGMPDPRQPPPRFGGDRGPDRGMVPLPGPTPVPGDRFPRGDAPRPPNPAVAVPPPARPVPDAGGRERDRYPRNPGERDPSGQRPPPIDNPLAREQQQRQWQIQRQQEEQVRRLQQQQAQQPMPMPAAPQPQVLPPALTQPPPRVQPMPQPQRPWPSGDLERAPRQIERPAMPMREPRAMPMMEPPRPMPQPEPRAMPREREQRMPMGERGRREGRGMAPMER